MRSYDYSQREGVEELSWERFAQLSVILTEKLADLSIDLVVGIARAGLLPATVVACGLRRELYPVRVTRRVDDVVSFEHPVWKVDAPPAVEGKAVAVVDEIADTGETLAIVADRVSEIGAERTIIASLIAHNWAEPAPEVVALVTDALVIFPWDKHVYVEGRWQVHPELVRALGLQGQ